MRGGCRARLAPAIPAPAIYAIFVLSGISGLIYQVVWVRWFSRIFGNTVYSASLVMGVFMLGLGVGSYLVGSWIDKRAANKPTLALKGYAYSEVAIAVLGALIAVLLPALEPLSAKLTFYAQGPDGWYEPSLVSYGLRFALAIVILAPITTIMGGTLTLLARYLIAADTRLAGWRMGFLYGFNTAGAALGAFLSDFALIPIFGLLSTQLVAVALNLFAAIAALRVTRHVVDGSSGHPVATAVSDAAPPPDAAKPTSTESRIVAYTGLAIFLSGFCAMGVEILWFRQFHIALGGYRAVFSLVLTVVLVGIWLGSLAGGACHRRFGQPARLYMMSQAAFVVFSMLLLATIVPQRGATVLDAEVYMASWWARLLVSGGVLKSIVLVVGLPAFLMGFAYPLANANIQRTQKKVGQRAGLLYLANTVGALLGSLCTGFVLIPALGLKGSIMSLAVAGTGSIVALYFAGARAPDGLRGKRATAWLCAGSVVASLAAVALWTRVPSDRFTRYGIHKGETVLTVSEGIYELIAVTERESGSRTLKTNGHSMSGTSALGQRYMRAFAHIPLLHQDNPTDALVICFGVGNTVHAASLHRTLTRIDVVDLSRHVLEHASYFEKWNHGVLRDPRVRVHVNDGRQHLWMRPEASYDLITLEPPPLALAGVSALYSRDFYKLARSRLRPGGFMSQWLPKYQIPEEAVRASVRAFIDVFPNAILLSGWRDELILVGANADTFTIDPAELSAKLEKYPAVYEDLKRIDFGTPTAIIGSFVASSEALRGSTEHVEPLTDDLPMMEYSAPPTKCWTSHFPADMIDVPAYVTWCPTCTVDGQPAPGVETLELYLRNLERYYRSADFLVHPHCAADRS